MAPIPPPDPESLDDHTRELLELTGIRNDGSREKPRPQDQAAHRDEQSQFAGHLARATPGDRQELAPAQIGGGSRTPVPQAQGQAHDELRA